MSQEPKATQPESVSVPGMTQYHAEAAQVVLAAVDSSLAGLTNQAVHTRQQVQGKNSFTKEKRVTVLARLWSQLRGPLALVLIGAFVVTFLLEEYVDAFVILAALLVAVIVGVVQEGRSSRAFETLAKSQTHHATVIRAGKKQQILAEDLVVGDIVVLQNGDQVPADVRIIEAKQLAINEAPLTGEWIAERKQTEPVPPETLLAEQRSMAWMGTFVAEGHGKGVVVAIGDQTAVGKLASDVRDVVEVATPIQREMEKVSHMMLYLICVLVTIIFAVGLLQGQSVHDMLIMAIAIAVASVPEGMPAAVTIILAVGMEALLKRGGLVRNLLAAETLGSTTYVLTDKTGTLTEAKMGVTGLISHDGEVLTVDETNSQYLKEVFDAALAATDAYVDAGAREYTIHGDPVEVAILRTAAQFGLREEGESLRAQRIDYLSFTSENRFAAGLSEREGKLIFASNGAPNLLLASAKQLLTPEGERELSDAHRQAIKAAIDQETKKGKRLVAVGYKSVNYRDIPAEGDTLLEDLVFAGVLVFDDPVRDGVAEAIAGVRSAGARVLLITGDNSQTALSIAQEVGIAKAGDVAMTGDAIAALSDDELWATLQDVPVYARVLPSQKMRIASVLQAKGQVVAMTGDGINDAPALRRANIGVAIGSGTEVAKEASDLVLMKDSFATIYAAIEEGRRITANLQKILGYLLSTSLSEVVLIGAALLVGAPVPILPVQILWSNIIEEGFMSVAFAFEPGDKKAMQRKPQDIHREGIFSKKMLEFIGVVVVIHGTILVGLYMYLLAIELPLEELRSVMFLIVALDSLFISFAFRSLTVPLWKVPLTSNLVFLGSFAVSACLFVGVLYVPFLQEVLQYQPIPAEDWFFVLGFSVLTLTTVEIAKWIFFEREK